ncbi:MAG: type II secretion system protein [Betaproteobacteria bacterium]|nr:type II secretion system protein [Betaproteobacteria bacterium]
MRTRWRARCGHISVKGFTYLTVLFIVAILAGGLALIGEVWHTAALREKEAELLHIGNQYRKAIERYYLTGQRQFPRALNDLIKDPRRPTTERYLRRIYPDPITGKEEWGFVKGPDGGIMGVYSLSEDKPLKSGNFQPRDTAFDGMTKYSDWKFVPTPADLAARGAPTKPPGGASPSASPSPLNPASRQ